MSSVVNISPIFIKSVATIATDLQNRNEIGKCLQTLIVMRIPIELIEQFQLKTIVEQVKLQQKYENLAGMALQKMSMAMKSAQKVEEPKKKDRKRRCHDEIGGPEAKKKAGEVAATPPAPLKKAKQLLAPGYKAPVPEIHVKADTGTFKIPKKAAKKEVDVVEKKVPDAPKPLMSLDIEVPENYRDRSDLAGFFRWIMYGS